MFCQNCKETIEDNSLFCPICGIKQDNNNNDEWYCIINNKKKGPYSTKDLIAKIRDGSVKKDTLIWQKGMSDWQVAGQSSFNDIFLTITPEIPNNMLDNRFIWALATIPIAASWSPYYFFENTTDIAYIISSSIVIVLNIVFATLDINVLKKSGKNPDNWLWLGLFLVPIYLFVRAAKTNKNYVYGIVWCIIYIIDIMFSQ